MLEEKHNAATFTSHYTIKTYTYIYAHIVVRSAKNSTESKIEEGEQKNLTKRLYINTYIRDYSYTSEDIPQELWWYFYGCFGSTFFARLCIRLQILWLHVVEVYRVYVLIFFRSPGIIRM